MAAPLGTIEDLTAERYTLYKHRVGSVPWARMRKPACRRSRQAGVCVGWAASDRGALGALDLHLVANQVQLAVHCLQRVFGLGVVHHAGAIDGLVQVV